MVNFFDYQAINKISQDLRGFKRGLFLAQPLDQFFA
jgi:hypothetical protein